MSEVTRRSFLASTATAGAVAGLGGFGGFHVHAAEPLVKAMPNAEKLGWRVGFSAYTFRALTLFETLDKIAEVGLHFTELFAWQKLSPQHPDAQPGPGLSKTSAKRSQEEGVGLRRPPDRLLRRPGQPRCGQGACSSSPPTWALR